MIDGHLKLCCGNTGLNRNHMSRKCCSGVIFDIDKEICVNGTVSSSSPTTEVPTTPGSTTTEIPTTPDPTPRPPGLIQRPLCGNTEYNDTTSICCNEQILSKLTGHRNCCSNVIYNTRNETCINGKVRRIRKGTPCGIYGEGEITNPFVCCNNTFHRIKRGRDQCCGNSTFNPTKQECCSGEVINLSEAKCCDGRKIAIHEDCCEGQGYDKGKAVCCQGQVFGLDELENYDLTHCCPAGQILDRKFGRCIKKGKNGKLIHSA